MPRSLSPLGPLRLMQSRIPLRCRIPLRLRIIRPWLVAVVQAAVVGSVIAANGLAQPPTPLAPAETSPDARRADPRPGELEDRSVTLIKPSLALPSSYVPPNAAAPRLAAEGVRYQPTGLGRGWATQPCEWEATALKHRPLYFEEPNLERLGYYYGWPCDGRVRRALFGNFTEYMATVHDDSPFKQSYFELKERLDCYQPHNQVLQPFVSAAHFFGRIPVLPYMLGAESPCCDQYELGTDRPGSPVPYRKHYIPLSAKGLLYQGAAATALPYLIP